MSRNWPAAALPRTILIGLKWLDRADFRHAKIHEEKSESEQLIT
jgi:hypothetical protein